MGWLSKAQNYLSGERPVNEKKSYDPFASLMGLTRKFAGEKVDVNSSTKISTVFACIRDKSESISQLPVYLKYDGKRIPAGQNERLQNIFTMRPCSFMNIVDFLAYGVLSIETTGNFYVYPLRNKYGNVTELIPLRHQNSVIRQYDAHGNPYYTYVTDDGKSVSTFENDELIHMKVFSMDGLNGESPILYNSRVMGIKMSETTYMGNIMESGQLSRGILHTDSVFKDEASHERLKREWDGFRGAKGMGRTPILENGLKYQEIGVSPADAKILEYGQFNSVQICSIFRVPPERVGIERKAPLKTLEEQNRDYLRSGLIPLIRQFEVCLSEHLPKGYTLHIDDKQFARGDFNTMAAAVGKVFSLGSISMNEMREALGWDYKDGGDVHAIDTNNLTFGTLEDIPRMMEEKRLMAQRALEAGPDDESDEDDQGNEDDE